ncbi:hypothetical protein ACFLUU_00925 [Chloroflexota bacterium]
MTEATYYQECVRLVQFLRRLPEADRHRKLQISIPRMPEEYHQPTFSPEEVETIIWACVLDNIPPDMVLRRWSVVYLGQGEPSLLN